MATQLLLGGYVYSPAIPDATAIAITDGVVSWVGSDHVGRALHPDAQVTDLAGRFVAPAFVDSHVHLTSTGLAMIGLDLSRTASLGEMLAMLADHAAAQAPGDVLWGLGWDESRWFDDAPTTSEIDAVVGDRPVYLARIDEHSAVCSSALRRMAPELAAAAGYSEQGPLIADAHHLVRSAARSLLAPATRSAAQRAALDAMAANGIVAVHENGGPDIGGDDDFRSLADIDHPVLIRRYWGESVTTADDAVALLHHTGAHGLGGDLFIDGSIGSHTALLSAPYADADTRGVQYIDADTVVAHIRACTQARIQAGFHVIGDAAVTIATDAFAAVAEELGTSAVAALGHRLEHAEMVTPTQAQTLAQCGVIAGMQPVFDALWGGPGELYEQRLGQQRGRELNNFAELARAGVGLSFSSDAPVTQPHPWSAIAAAVNHHNPASGISPRAAFSAASRGGWRAGGSTENGVGQLIPGAPAHYAVWEVDELVASTGAAGIDAVRRWSTDPRARVPLLPGVAPGATLPRCVRTALGGSVIFSDGL